MMINFKKVLKWGGVHFLLALKCSPSKSKVSSINIFSLSQKRKYCQHFRCPHYFLDKWMVVSAHGQVGVNVARRVVLVPVQGHESVIIQLQRMMVSIVLDLRSRAMIVLTNIVPIMVSRVFLSFLFVSITHTYLLSFWCLLVKKDRERWSYLSRVLPFNESIFIYCISKWSFFRNRS